MDTVAYNRDWLWLTAGTNPNDIVIAGTVATFVIFHGHNGIAHACRWCIRPVAAVIKEISIAIEFSFSHVPSKPMQCERSAQTLLEGLKKKKKKKRKKGKENTYIHHGIYRLNIAYVSATNLRRTVCCNAQVRSIPPKSLPSLC